MLGKIKILFCRLQEEHSSKCFRRQQVAQVATWAVEKDFLWYLLRIWMKKTTNATRR